MLTIENFQRLKGRVIGLTGYYVSDIKPVEFMDIRTYEQVYYYMIELTNRQKSIIVQLSRQSEMVNGVSLYDMTLGAHCKQTITKYELRNTDIVVNSITQLVLQQYIP